MVTSVNNTSSGASSNIPPQINVPRRQPETFWSHFVLASTPLFVTIRSFITFQSVLTLLFLLRAGVILFVQWRILQVPYANMRSFAAKAEETMLPAASGSDWKFDEYDLFAQSSCVQSRSAELLRERLHEELLRIPREVRSEIVDNAIVEDTCTTNSIQNTVDNMLEDGAAFGYMAFWSTSYSSGGMMVAPAKYST